MPAPALSAPELTARQRRNESLIWLLVWLGAGVLLVLPALGQWPLAVLALPRAVALRWAVIWVSIWAALTPVIRALARRFPIAGPARFRHGVYHLLAALVLIFVSATLEVVLNALWAGWSAETRAAAISGSFPRLLVWRYPRMLALYVLIAAVTQVTESRRGLFEREVRASRLEAQLAAARLALLRAQLEPHFLFNSLQAISTLMRRDVEQADRLLANLSDLLRAALERLERPEIGLGEELDFARAYLELEQARLGDRLRFTIEAEPDFASARVPSLLLQPLIENAVRHGIAPRARGGSVCLTARRRDAQLELEILDDGVGFEPGAPPRGKGIGLQSTRARLAEHYGEAGRFQLLPHPEGGTRVLVTLPWRTEDEDDRADR